MKKKISLMSILALGAVLLLSPVVYSKEKKMKNSGETPETVMMDAAAAAEQEPETNRLDQLLDMQDAAEGQEPSPESVDPVSAEASAETDVEVMAEPAGLPSDETSISTEAVTEPAVMAEQEVNVPEVAEIPPVADLPAVATGSAAKVEQIQLTADAGGAKQIAAAVSGSFIENCVEIESISKGKDFVKKVFWAKINTVKGNDCQKTGTTFKEKVLLDVDGVSGGEYTFEINGARQAFLIHEGKEPFFEIKSGG